MVFTNSAIQLVINFFDDTYGTGVSPTHIGVGTDSTTPDEEDTTLAAEAGRYAVASKTASSDKISFEVIVTSTQLTGQTLREFGVFNAATAGTMFSRTTNASITKTSSIEVRYEVILKVTN